ANRGFNGRQIAHFDGTTGKYLGAFQNANMKPYSVAFAADGTAYVSSRSSGGTGTSVDSDGIFRFTGPFTSAGPSPLVVQVAATKFYVVNDGSPDKTYEYNASGGLVESYNVNSGNSAPRGAATTALG